MPEKIKLEEGEIITNKCDSCLFCMKRSIVTLQGGDPEATHIKRRQWICLQGKDVISKGQVITDCSEFEQQQ